jgi:hypothetical protein
MKTELLTYLTDQLTGSIKTSQELPFQEGNNPLYLRNPRRVYLDEPKTEQRSMYATLGGCNVNERTITIKGFLSVDAKNRNQDLDQALDTLGSAKDITTITGVHKREFDYITTIDNDRLIYEFEYRFSNIA